ncbi:probable transcription factor At3g04930 [Impatiens glandulifera]|uniref:probable transcription factor At3g04930 n=1 Tax=Impatiens glandulifera TaxID=253017 RepID=UPI001FB12F69|nr:probable transcription factor At3g04930 [Impatiens glandulifera]
MASEENHPTYAAFPDLDEDDDDDTEEEDLEHPPKRTEDIDDDDEDDDEDDDTSSSNLATGGESIVLPSSSSSKVTVAVAGDPAVSVAQAVTIALPATDFTPDPKRLRIEGVSATGIEKGAKPLAVFDESRRLFQRLWTDEDEIEILQGFLDYTKQRGNSASHHQDTSAFYDLIKSKLQLDFNKSQLVEKLRRLKKKYRNILGKIGPGKSYLFKTPHEHATFEICRRIWSADGTPIGGGGYEDDETNPNNPNPHANSVDRINNGLDANSERKAAASKSRKRTSKGVEKTEEKPHFPHLTTPPTANPTSNPNPNPNPTQKNTAPPFPNMIEETVRSCLSPLFKDLIQGNMNGPCSSRGGFLGVAMNSMPFGLWNPSSASFSGGGGDVMEEKWRKQQILELEVYSKRLELVQDQIKSALEELRSPGS